MRRLSSETFWEIAGWIAERIVHEISTKWSIHVSVFLAIVVSLVLSALTLIPTHCIKCLIILAIATAVVFIVPLLVVKEDGASTLVFMINAMDNTFIEHMIRDKIVKNLEEERHFTCWKVKQEDILAYTCLLDLGKEKEYNIKFFKLHYHIIYPGKKGSDLLINIYVDIGFYGNLYHTLEEAKGSLIYKIKSRKEALVPRTRLSELREDLMLEIYHLLKLCESNNLKLKAYT